MTILIILAALGYFQVGYHLAGKGILADYRKRKEKGRLVTAAYPFRAYLNGSSEEAHPLEDIVGDLDAERRYCRRMSVMWPYVLGKGFVAGLVIGTAEAPGNAVDLFFEGPGRVVRALRGKSEPSPPVEPDAESLRDVEEALDSEARFKALEEKEKKH